MSSLIEGIGDEVVYCVGTLAAVALLSLAWLSTGVRPLWGQDSVWYVHLQTWPTRRILQVLHIQPNGTPTVASPDAQGHTHGHTHSHSHSHLPPPTPNTSTLQLDPAQVEELGQASSSEELSADLISSSITSPSSPSASLPPTSSAAGAEGTQATSAAAASVEPLPAQSAAPPSGPPSRIRLKFLDETQRWVDAVLEGSVGDFMRRHFEAEVNHGKVVRLIYQGQLLRDEERSLASYGLAEGAVLHCHVSNTPLDASGAPRRTNLQRPPTAAPDVAPNGGPGRYLYLFVGLKLCGMWALWASFPDYFDLTASVAMVLLSLFALGFAWYSLRPTPPQAPAAAQSPPPQPQGPPAQ